MTSVMAREGGSSVAGSVDRRFHRHTRGLRRQPARLDRPFPTLVRDRQPPRRRDIDGGRGRGPAGRFHPLARHMDAGELRRHRRDLT